MITQETINKLKQIPIVDYLKSKGHQPVKKNGANNMYHSPLRKDSNPSFSVNSQKNVFHDFGNPSDKGGVIDLVMKLERITFPKACEFLSSNLNGANIENASFFSSCQKSEKVKTYKITDEKELSLKYLIFEIQKRKIRLNTAKIYLKEVYWEINQQKYHGYGYKTDEGTYAVRNKYMEKFYFFGSAGITTFGTDEKTISIFEGLFDFLSHLDNLNTSKLDHKVIILNSVYNLHLAQVSLANAKNIHCYLDNDDGGRKTLATIRTLASSHQINIIDHSNIYKGYKDYSKFYETKNI